MLSKSQSIETELIIRHIPDGDGSLSDSGRVWFRVERRGDGKEGPPVEIVPPGQVAIDGPAGSNLLVELQWYLEEFLEYPFSPNTERAERILAALAEWGRSAFLSLFGDRQVGGWFDSLVQAGSYADLQLRIASDDPRVLAWPWEALRDPQAHELAKTCRIQRQLNLQRDPPPLPRQLPSDHVNLLLVIARPYEGDVKYRSLARPVVEMIRKQNLPVQVDVLRPPTFDALRDHLRQHPGQYHIVHFDGHGGFDETQVGSSSHSFRAKEGLLVFENDQGESHCIPANKLSALLQEYSIPVMVLNACQSAMLDPGAAGTQDAFASVATALLQSGMRGVVAMSYSVYVSAMQQFLPDFYRRLFESGNLAEAMRAGRQQMFAHDGRVCARGEFPLADWLVPVLYEQQPFEFKSFSKASGKAVGKKSPKAALSPAEKSEAVQEITNRLGDFIGRDGPLLELERALRRRPAAIVVHGLGGVGKTTLARGFIQWLSETNGLGSGCLWLSFAEEQIRSAEYVINRIGTSLFGDEFRLASLEERLQVLTTALKENRFLIVWDNFEVVAGLPEAGISAYLSEDDRGLLGRFVAGLHGGQTKVLITSRAPETWLGDKHRLPISLTGLDGEERWELFGQLRSDLGLKIDRNDPELAQLMNLLCGHPLSMHMILPRLRDHTAGQILHAVQHNLADLHLPEDAQSALTATLKLVVDGLAPELQPLLTLVASHEGFLDADWLELMAKQIGPEWTRERIHRLLTTLEAAGLVRDVGQSVYELHPVLTSGLRIIGIPRAGADVDCWTTAFVDVVARVADYLAPLELHQQRAYIHWHSGNFQSAIRLAERLGMNEHFAAVLQAQAAFAQNVRDFTSATKCFTRLAEYSQQQGDLKGEAAAYHQLGMIAAARRDWGAAEGWYLKSLAIDEKQGNEHGAAMTYHQLGVIAQERRDWGAAEGWYRKSLAIKEKQGNEHGAASTYHQLGRIAQERRDWRAAEGWYLKSLAIKEKQGDEHGAAITYNQLGSLALWRRDWGAAEGWYLKSLAIKEKQGNEHGAAITYHQLGMIAAERGDWGAAEGWYLKSLAISEKQGNEHHAASTYHQLGRIAAERRDWGAAEGWCLKSLAISEKQGNEHHAAITYHQLGVIAAERRDWGAAEGWYLKSLAISEKQGNEHHAASTYHQLGMIAEERRDWGAAEGWYLKSLAISEKQGNEHGAALSYGQLGLLCELKKQSAAAADWLLKGLTIFMKANSPHYVDRTVENILRVYQAASPAEQAEIREKWLAAGLGAFPDLAGPGAEMP